MTIKEKALEWWAETIKDGKNVVSSAQITDQRQRAFLVKRKLIYRIARGYWLLKRPEDDSDEVFPLVYWEIIEAVLARYTWSVRELSAATILNGGQGAQKELRVGTKEKTNWKLPLIGDFSISIHYEPHFDDRLIKKTKVANREITIDIPEKVLIDINKIDLPETRNFVAGTDFDLRKLEALYSRSPKPIVFRRLIGISKSADRSDLVAGLETRPKTPSAALSSASARSRNRTYAPSPRRSSALHPELWAAFSSFDRPEGFSAGLLERIIGAYTHYSLGKKEKVDIKLAAKKPTTLKPPWVLRQEQQIEKFAEVLTKELKTPIGRLKKYPLDKLLAQAEEHKKYDTYHSTSLEGYRITPAEVNALLSGETPKEIRGQGDAYVEKIKNRMAILGYSAAFDFTLNSARSDFKHPSVS